MTTKNPPPAQGHGTKIEWTHIPGYTGESWNPLRGCSLKSAGCEKCYAMKQAHRYSGPGMAYEGLTEIGPDGPRWNGKIKMIEDQLSIPLHWKKPRAIFVNSMSDLFHPEVPFDFIDKVMAVAALCPQHIFIVLTKRPGRMAEYMNTPYRFGDGIPDVAIDTFSGFRDYHWNGCSPWEEHVENIHDVPFPYPNLWLGVSVENQKTADERIPPLLKCPAAVRLVSYEPALGGVDLADIQILDEHGLHHFSCLESEVDPEDDPWGNACIDWVIAGGESGPGARPSHPDNFRKVRDQCAEADVPFFFKQHGEWAETGPINSKQCAVCGCGWSGPFYKEDIEHHHFKEHCDRQDRQVMYRVGKKAAGDLLDGVQHHHFPEVDRALPEEARS